MTLRPFFEAHLIHRLVYAGFIRSVWEGDGMMATRNMEALPPKFDRVGVDRSHGFSCEAVKTGVVQPAPFYEFAFK